MTAKTRLALLAVPALLALAWLWWPGTAVRGTDPHATATAATSDQQQTRAATDWATRGHDAGFQSGLENLPASLAGTDVPDGLRTDDQGNLVVSAGLRDVFDYFLSVIGEEDMGTIVARLRAYLDSQLPASAASQANQILNNYLAFRESLRDLAAAGGPPGDSLDIDAVRAQQAAVRAQRQQFLSATVDEAFFAAQDTWNDYGLSRLDILQDAGLSASEKAQKLAALRAGLPDGMQRDVDAVLQYQDLQALTRELQQQGASEADVRLLREQVVGAEAADRLEALAQERADFSRRVDQWLALRDDILANSNLADADRDAQVARLRQARFSDSEQLRVQALEATHDRQSPGQ
ncbi:MAG: lipase secretion chaperone [Alcanivoracaceae bacterium]